MLCKEVENYIASAKGVPFFYAVGDDTYAQTLSELKQRGLEMNRISDFCPRDDKYPDLDELIDHFRTLDVDYSTNRYVLVGLGEYLALRGSAFAESALRRLKNTTLGTARVVLLLRSVTPELYRMAREDHRLSEQQRVYLSPGALSSVAISCVKYPLGTNAANGVKGLLRTLEDGAAGTCSVSTNMDLSGAIYPVSSVNTAYEALLGVLRGFEIAEQYGSEEQWDQLFHELSKKKSLDAVYAKYDITDDVEDDFYQNCSGLEFRNWLFFLFLKQHSGEIENNYLKFVVEKTDRFDLLKGNILTAIINVDRLDARYSQFYWDRKKLIGGFPESDLAIFVHANEVDSQESIFRFTDTTDLERREIIQWVAKNGYLKEIDAIYPALGQYLADYTFDCEGLSALLTQYFRQYRIQKVENKIRPEFLEQVLANAADQPYARLETRDSAILRIPEKRSTFLYWIDALGVEFLPYMTALARKRGLAMHVDITYAALPTITSFNKAFFDNWPGRLKYKEEELDDIKHKARGGYNFEKCEAPIHLVAELKVIERAVDRAATELAMHTCKAFVIASDHGASRLAVIHRQEEKYETDTKGEHSGRCCKAFEGCDLPYAIFENGYVVLADYGRFRESRAANVEVHGGAALEEVVVPIITLKLKRQSDLVIRIVNPGKIYANRHNGTTFELYLSDVENGENLSVAIGDKRYQAARKDEKHYIVSMPDMRRARKNISASVFDGEDLVGNVNFDIKSRLATMDSGFDELI